ncbi:MAG: EAL domain-containing protein [Gammaproteobacteria bacterium]|nr:EAL domain-containing protein [Gammaproteobacteria bacterium]
MPNLTRAMINRVLVVDDDAQLIGEYVRCLGAGFEPDTATATLGDLEKVLFGEETDETGAARFEVHSRNQGEPAVDAVRAAVAAEAPYAIVFLDVDMPPGIDGIEAARQIRALDPNVNIVIVSGSMNIEAEILLQDIPPSDKIFFFKKPFHVVECRQLAAALCGKWHADKALRQANEDLEKRVEERMAALHKLAYYDPVTGLPNQFLLLDKLQALIEQAEDAEGDTVTVLLDIDRFSFINETLGYDSGSELLCSVANRLGDIFGRDDSVKEAVVGRFGADEFAVIVPGVHHEDDVRTIAARVKESVEQPFLINGRDLFLKVAIGVAWHPEHGRDAKSVFRSAEAALHRSMRTVDHGVTYYHREMRFKARSKFDMEAELRGAIAAGHIQAWYQPQQNTETGELAGAEALARWIRPDGTVVPPSIFVPLSEEIGLSNLLFETVLASVCRDIAVWQEAGSWDVPVSVNLSPHQLRDSHLAGLIKKTLAKHEINADLIKLELTETVLLEDLTVVAPLLQELSEFGIGIYVDDFGTGYSSLSYLAQLPVEAVKIDRAFVAKLADSDTTVRVVQAIVALGQAMSLNVIAEGVESDQQYAIVRRLGCHCAQGFFVAQPMSPSGFIIWCEGHEDTQSLKHGASIVNIDKAPQ